MNDTTKTRRAKLKTLRPKEPDNEQFFIADEYEIVSFKDDIRSMEHPFFVLKSGDAKERHYENGNKTIKIKSIASVGIATVFDKDIWIYAVSKLQRALDEHSDDVNKFVLPNKVSFTAYDYFTCTNKSKGGKSYTDLEKCLERLASTRITTNISHDDSIESHNFGLIESYKIKEGIKGNSMDVTYIEIILPSWILEAIKTQKVLKISNDYFRIRKAIDRRIYEIARKHCGSQKSFIITLDKLYIKTGASSALKVLRNNVIKLAKDNDLPDYFIEYDPVRENVTFKPRPNILLEAKKRAERIAPNNKLDPTRVSTPDQDVPAGFRGS
ncbi:MULTISPECIES: replication initiator protein A [Rosenbergiella]|uniref:replication initiator protein A n=1 Tax=Rosenbergiella TaxID=1356488 RepID=UPI001F502BB3